MTPPKIAVIIPFFQRTSGVLARSLASIAAQHYPSEALYVLIIDDGSPLPAHQELHDHPPADGLNIRVVQQTNAGPNEARNTGLINLEPGTDLIAYLDSDDEWIGDHLRRATHALAQGYSAYFANLFHLGDSTNEFDKAKRVRHEDHPAVANDPTLRAYQGDMVHQIATANIIFMPSLVISVHALGSARFPQAHRHGGGDYLYWMDLITHGAQFVYSTLAEVRCGAGINMWYGSGWGTDGLAMRIVDEARFRRKVLEIYARSGATKTSLRMRLTELQTGMLQDMVHRLRHKKPVHWKTVTLFFRENPPTFSMAFAMLSALKGRLTSQQQSAPSDKGSP
jgi:succinoglycan biosynthesis protein ExoW